MQLHPGVIRDHHQPTLARYGPDTGHDLPDVAAFTRPAAAAAARLRHASEPAPRAVHGRRDGVLARDRTARGLLSERLRGRAVVVSRQPRGHRPLPRGGHRLGGLRQDEWLHRRHARPSARSRPGTTPPGEPTPRSSRPSSRRTSSARTRPPRSRANSSPRSPRAPSSSNGTARSPNPPRAARCPPRAARPCR